MNENALDLIRSRRTIRKFSEQAVSKEQIETLEAHQKERHQQVIKAIDEIKAELKE